MKKMPLEEESMADLASKWGLRLLIVTNIMMFCGLCYQYGIRDIVHPTEGWNWTDFITILLAIVTIVIAALGTLIAVAALWGLQTLRKGASEISRKKVDGYLQSADMERKLRALVEEQYKNYVDSLAVARALTSPERGDRPNAEQGQRIVGDVERDWRD
ncbi:hypothetical protein [Azospirillum humicireducens]|uniref:hypothetical protein n=1 Tax=Azospirillum humicireducens TaxID=1226968 RepID=UPI0011B1FEC4|nr:hypothetical protein [Azospirillum humicireducens]